MGEEASPDGGHGGNRYAFVIFGAIAALAALGLLMGSRGNSGDDTPASAPATTTSVAPYDGAEYAGAIQAVLLGSFPADPYPLPSFEAACHPPNEVGWLCAIGSITSPEDGWIEVTLQPDWESAFGEWTGPPAGIGCPKWGEKLERNITNFVAADGRTATPRLIRVVEPNGRNC